LWQPLGITEKRVCVIPDGFLYYLNFESLISPEDGNKPHFLIEKVEFRYANSLSELHLYEQLAYADSPSTLFAFSPGFDDRLKDRSENSSDEFFKQLLRQPWAIATSELLQKKYGAKAYTREAATEEVVKKLPSSNAVVYFGTHAFLSNDDPLFSRLVLSKAPGGELANDGYLYSYEIYGCALHLNTVILSACQTGLGKLQNGNGMASIASSFNYAGCKTVLMSLWSIDDEKSAEIIQKFYAYLGQGHLKSEALRLAKLDYLQSADAELSSPFYWSGMVMLGENNAVTFATPSLWERFGWWMLVLGVLFVTFFKFAKKLKPS
jgi:CHAT domain-containing protein